MTIHPSDAWPKKTVTAMLHNSFPEIQERLRTLNGRVSKVGKRKADKRRQGRRPGH